MAETFEPMEGGCLCGAVRYEVTEAPVDVYYCHCRICQRSAGSPVNVTARLPRAGFRLLRGELKFYSHIALGERGFCPNCGSGLCYRPLDKSWLDWIWVKVASLDEPERIRPQRHVGIESQMPWFEVHDELPRMASDEGGDPTIAWATVVSPPL